MSKNLSAIKKLQVSLRNNLRNKIYKSKIKTVIKKTLTVVNSSNPDLVDQSRINAYLSEAYSIIDKAVNKGIIKKNKASRQKSRLLRKCKKYC